MVTSPVAASHKTPILLVSKNGASKELRDYVKKTIDYLIIVGGKNLFQIQ
ncbi:MAG: cell wall-binding repeat-containing protein [Finegoldia magna]|nr:cell wall-binding repeat-containing protein [Finegoldia magna]